MSFIMPCGHCFIVVMSEKKRIDLLLHERGMVASREAARTAIMVGAVLVNGQKVTKPGMLIRGDAAIELTGQWREVRKFVSRGGLKLEKALAEFGVDVEGITCLDVGASTGGFTHCLLHFGAARVYAIDVGYGQLDWSLRQDNRVVVLERVNARNLSPHSLYSGAACGPYASLAVMDLSFISLEKVLPAVLTCLSEGSEIIALIKPQFEAGANVVGKGGVVRSAELHQTVIEGVSMFGSKLELAAINLTFSPVKGPAGNIEFLIHWKRNASPAEINIAAVVARAHEELNAGSS